MYNRNGVSLISSKNSVCTYIALFLPSCILIPACQAGAFFADYKRISCTDLEISICSKFLTSQTNFYHCYASSSSRFLFLLLSTKELALSVPRFLTCDFQSYPLIVLFFLLSVLSRLSNISWFHREFLKRN